MARSVSHYSNKIVSVKPGAVQFGFPPSPNGGPALLSLLGLQGVIELVGGVLIVLGLFTRPVAFILAGDMAVAYFMSHAPRSFFPTLNGGDAAILYCFVFLYFVAAGPGAWAADIALRREAEPGPVSPRDATVLRS